MGCYPKLSKIGQITPIYKAGKCSEATNYRGVNDFPNLTKVSEQIVYEQLKLIITPAIEKTKHEFSSNRNIKSNLLELTNRIHEAFKSNTQLDVFNAN